MASGWSFGSAAKPDLWGVPTVEMGGRGTLHDRPTTSGGWGGFSGTTEIKEVPATATTPAREDVTVKFTAPVGVGPKAGDYVSPAAGVTGSYTAPSGPSLPPVSAGGVIVSEPDSLPETQPYSYGWNGANNYEDRGSIDMGSMLGPNSGNRLRVGNQGGAEEELIGGDPRETGEEQTTTPVVAKTERPINIPIVAPPAQVAPTIKVDKVGVVEDLATTKLKEGTKVSAQPITEADKLVVTEAALKQGKEPALGVPEGFSTTPKPGKPYTQEMPPLGMMFIYDNETGDRKTVSETGAVTYEAAKAGETGVTQAAQGQVSLGAIAKVDEQTALTREAVAAGRDSAAEQAALGTAATRPDAKDYAAGATTDEKFVVEEVEGPKVTTREGLVIGEKEKADLLNLAKERGVNVEDLPEYKLARERTLQVGTAANKEYSDRLGIPPEEVAAQATYYASDFTADGGPTDIAELPVFKVAAKRVAQTGTAAQRIARELGTAPSVDLEGRKAITGTVPQGDAAQIGGVPTLEAATRQAVTGEARSVGAADMLAVVANVPKVVSAALSEDPAKVEAAIDRGDAPQLTAAVAALPVEALVSTQMEQLLAGMEEGKTPAWARPAVAAIEQQMAQRGLTASTVGRDALFNAIIQSALPMAQSNAQALQQRAAQNLSNEQQVNLATAQNTMTIRMQNLANTQTAASQSAQMANEIKLQQGTFKQQAVLTTAEQEQQTALTNAKMAQEKAQQESAQKQQAAIATLNVAAQADLANLQALNAASSENLSAEQQSKLASYNAQVDRIVRTADLKQDMEKANLSASLQIEMQRISELNAAAKDTMTAEQTERLTNLQTLIDFRKTDATFAQQMDMANMSNEQQMRLANLSEKAATDSANFTAENQFELARLNAIVDRNVRKAELEQRMKEVNLDANLKVELTELSEKNVTARANMTAEQQTRLANLNVLVDFRKTNAELAQQMDLVNLGNEQQMELANLAERAATDAANFTEANRFRFQELNNHVTIMSQNEQLRQNADLARLSTAEKISLSNLTQKNQAASESMSAENVAELQMYEKKMQAGQINAQLAQQMGLANLSNKQEAAMFNAQMNGNLDMKQMDANQQMAIANSQFMQTMTQTKFSADQQAAMQNAAAMASMDMANIDQRTRLAVENAKSFLAMDMANLNNNQQGIILDQQMEQQRILSDQAAINAAAQFNAASENDVNQFMASLAANMTQFNTTQANAMSQFNATEKNRAAAIDAGNKIEVEKFNSQLITQIDQFNAANDLQRDQWNAANEQAVANSNIEWRRQSNTIDTAALNASNQLSAQMTYNIGTAENANLWQTLRDEANYLRQSYENEEQRKTTLYATALSNEGASGGTSSKGLMDLATSFFNNLTK
jgi:hypothetical protein